jgi:hypothetical protein
MNRPKTSQVRDFEAKTATALGLGYSPQDMGVTTRPSSSSLFCISSADRYKDIAARREFATTPFRFTITKNESLLNGFLSRIALTEVRFPWTLPNISADAQTNTIRLGTTTNTDTITIPDGFYTPKELAAKITSVWNALYAGDTIQMVFASIDGVFRFAANSGLPVSVSPNPAITTGFKQMYDLMNWSSAASSAVLKISGVPTLRWTDYIDIVCNQLTYNQDLTDTSSQTSVRNMLCRVYLDETMISDASYMDISGTSVNNASPPISTFTALVGYGGKQNGVRPCIIYRQFVTPKYINWNRIQPVGQVQFEVYDDQGRCLADFIPATSQLAGNDWNFTLLASEQ